MQSTAPDWKLPMVHGDSLSLSSRVCFRVTMW